MVLKDGIEKMQINDMLNGAFELVGAYLVWLNVKKIRKDKQVRGLYWKVWGFFAVWGIWNLYYYPSLGQWASFGAGVVMVLGNVTWVYYAIKYRNN